MSSTATRAAQSAAGPASAGTHVSVPSTGPSAEPGGPTVAEVEKLLCGLRDRGAVVGAGLTGLAPDPANVEKLERLCTALGF